MRCEAGGGAYLASAALLAGRGRGTHRLLVGHPLVCGQLVRHGTTRCMKGARNGPRGRPCAPDRGARRARDAAERMRWGGAAWRGARSGPGIGYRGRGGADAPFFLPERRSLPGPPLAAAAAGALCSMCARRGARLTPHKGRESAPPPLSPRRTRSAALPARIASGATAAPLARGAAPPVLWRTAKVGTLYTFTSLVGQTLPWLRSARHRRVIADS